jgi:hypothetical protein
VAEAGPEISADSTLVSLINVEMIRKIKVGSMLALIAW